MIVRDFDVSLIGCCVFFVMIDISKLKVVEVEILC